MNDKNTSSIGRWSQRKTAHRNQKPRSRGPRITFADDAEPGEEVELLAETLHEQPILTEPITVPDTQESALESSDEDDGSVDAPADDSPEALDDLAREHDLAPLDSLNEESDFKPYMQSGIPDMLKQAAMRRLWRIDPAFGFLDGMNDYDENYRIIDKLITAMDTSYKVGRGFLDDDDLAPEDDAETDCDQAVAEQHPPEDEPESESEDAPEDAERQTVGDTMTDDSDADNPDDDSEPISNI